MAARARPKRSRSECTPCEAEDIETAAVDSVARAEEGGVGEEADGERGRASTVAMASK